MSDIQTYLNNYINDPTPDTAAKLGVVYLTEGHLAASINYLQKASNLIFESGLEAFTIGNGNDLATLHAQIALIFMAMGDRNSMARHQIDWALSFKPESRTLWNIKMVICALDEDWVECLKLGYSFMFDTRTADKLSLIDPAGVIQDDTQWVAYFIQALDKMQLSDRIKTYMPAFKGWLVSDKIAELLKPYINDESNSTSKQQ